MTDAPSADRRLPPQPEGAVALDARYFGGERDALVARNLLLAEVIQRRETGYDVDDIVRAANAADHEDRATVLGLVDAMATAPRGEGWEWEEPGDLAAIFDAAPGVPDAAGAIDQDRLADRIHAAWLGRIAGCNLGKPIEVGDYWTPERIRSYLESVDAYPLTDYVPVTEAAAEHLDLHETWPDTTRGRVDGSARDDDIDYSILTLHLLETYGDALTTADVGREWLSLFPLRQVYTAERAAYINLTNGLTAPETARFRNPYREWIGAQIRADVYGYVHPGDLRAAAEAAYRDAALSHTANGIYGEMWAAALVSAAFVSADAREAVERSLAVVPERSRLAAALRHVLSLHDSGIGWDDALAEVRTRYGRYSWVHTVNNAAALATGLLWGEADATTTIGRTVMAGWDTDSNGATAGSVAGILFGTSGLPAQLVDPLRDTTRSALFGFDNSRISDLADRTLALVRTR